MDVRNFSIARDLLYLSGALTGVALGYILSLFKKGITIRSRNRRLTMMLFVFSGALAAFSAAIVSSFGDIFSDGGLFLVAGICVPVFALAVFFPRAAAYPFMLAGGLLAVWLGYSFLRFPLIAESRSPLLYVHHEGDDVYSIRILTESGKAGDRAEKITVPAVPAGDRAAAAVFQINGSQPPLDIEGAFIRFHPRYPLVGGTERGLVTLIRRGDEVVYVNSRPRNSLLNPWHSRLGPWGIIFQHIGGTVPLDTIRRGTELAVSFADGDLSLKTSGP
ncbi:MAG: hypothetical protein LBE14_01700 [Treponema sp.]|jgi:hypothetical protein|nr:hypothetical protein [Treponema sp.]